MGLANRPDRSDVTQGNVFQRIVSGTGRIFSLSGDTADKIVFYGCVLLFFVGGITLKIGEYNEENIRQKALGMKHLYEENGYLYYELEALVRQGYSEDEIKDITFRYPDEFVKSGSRIVCVDSSVKKNVFSVNHILLDYYLREKLRQKPFVYLEDLFQDDLVWNEKTNKKDKELKNVKNFFSPDIVYTYLILPTNKEKYNLDVINDRTVIIKQ